MSDNPVQFKLDVSSLPKLSIRGDNFTSWRSAWTVAFKYSRLWQILQDTSKPPDADATWDTKDTQAMVMLMSAVHPDLTQIITAHPTSALAWQALADRFDRDTGQSTIQLFRNVTTLRHRDGEDLVHHLDEFNQLWLHLQRRCYSSSQTVARSMKTLFDSDDIKGTFFLTTLPEEMNNVVDNLSSRNVTKFADIETSMLDLADRHHVAEKQEAYYTSTATRGKGKQNANTQRNTRTTPTAPTGEKECTWCRKHNFRFVGHLYTNCDKLAADKAKRREKAKLAESTTEAPDTDDSTEDVAFTASAHGSSKRSAIHIDDDEASTTTQAEVAKLVTPLISSNGAPTWIFDTGASRHMTGSVDDFQDLRPHSGLITVAGGARLPIEGIGTVSLHMRLPDNSTKKCTLTNVLYSRSLHRTRLFSWTHVRKRFHLTGKKDDIYITNDADSSELLWAKYVHGNFVIQTVDNEHANFTVSTETPVSYDTPPLPSAHFTDYKDFHNSIGHSDISTTMASRLYKDTDTSTIPPRPHDFHCDDCAMAKSVHRVPKSVPTGSRATSFLHTVHSDLSGRFSVKSSMGSLYFISFIDEYSRYSWVRFLKTKDEAPKAIKDFCSLMHNQYGCRIKQFQTDHGGEYCNQTVRQFFEKQGITHRKTPPYHHESNGIAERFNRTIVTDARTMLSDNELLFLWPEAISTANYLRTIKPHSSLPNFITPHERALNTKPSIAHLKPFLTPCYTHIPKEARAAGTKLLDRAERALLVGYEGSSVYRVFIPQRKVVMTCAKTNLRWAPHTPQTIARWSTQGTHDTDPTMIKLELQNPAPPKYHQNQVEPAIEVSSRPHSPSQQLQAECRDSIPCAELDDTHSITEAPGKSFRHTQSSTIPSQLGKRKTRERSSDGRSESIYTTHSGRQVKPTLKARAQYGQTPDLETHDIQESSSSINSLTHDTRQQCTAFTHWQNESTAGTHYKQHHPPPARQCSEDDDTREVCAFITELLDDNIPSTYQQAVASPEAEQWTQAMRTECQSHIDNGTFTEVRVQDVKQRDVIDGRWVYAKKYNSDGTLSRHKARLVARGFTQIHGINYDDTYSPVARYDSLRIIICIATLRGWLLHQLDFDTAYLNSSLSHTIYMRCPPGWPTTRTDTVLLVNKALYGLKQSGREWFGTLNTALLRQGYKPCQFDPCVYIKDDIIIAVYVDDLLIAGTPGAIDQFKTSIATIFKCKDLGRCTYLLGLELEYHPHGVLIHQRSYIRRLLRRFDMQDCNGRMTPLDAHCFPPRRLETEEAANPKEYQRITGSINFLVSGTRPDIAFASSMAATFNSNPSTTHVNMVRQTLRYLKQTDHQGIFITAPRDTRSRQVSLDMYADASYNCDPDTSKSFAGMVLQLNGNTIAWSAKRQATVAKSTCEAEYMSCSKAASHVVWVRLALRELHVPVAHSWLHCDNQPAQSLVENHKVTPRSKHIAVHYHYVREHNAKSYTIRHIESRENVADVCTKALPRPALQYLITKLNMTPTDQR